MELLEQQVAPFLSAAGPAAGQRFHQISFQQQPLKTAVVALLIRPAGGAGPMQFEVELIAPERQLRRQGLQLQQVAPRRTEASRCAQGLVLPQGQLIQHFAAGAAAVIPHPRQPQPLLDAGGLLPLAAVVRHGDWVTIGADGCTHQGQHLLTAGMAPAEQTVREGLIGIPEQLVGDEPRHAAGLADRRQALAEPKAVGQPGQVVVITWQGLMAVVLAFVELAQQGGAAHQRAIRLDPGAVEGFPAPRSHGFADGGKEGGPVLLQPVVERRRGMAKLQLRV